MQRVRQISCVVLALKKAGFPVVGYFCIVLSTFKTQIKNSSTYFLVLLAILLDQTYIQLRVNYSPFLQLFLFYVFPALFSA